MSEVSPIILSFFLGVFFHYFIQKMIELWNKRKSQKVTEGYFEEIRAKIEKGNSYFISRINNLVILSSKMDDFGDVVITYNIEPREVTILKDNKPILSSKQIALQETIKLTTTIEKIHKEKLNDNVEMFGQIFNRTELENSLKDTISLLSKEISERKGNREVSQPDFNIDEILDKINTVGMDGLTPEEKEFLRKYKN